MYLNNNLPLIRRFLPPKDYDRIGSCVTEEACKTLVKLLLRYALKI